MCCVSARAGKCAGSRVQSNDGRALIPHGVKRHPLGIEGVDGWPLRRVVVWRAASPMHSTAMLEACEIEAPCIRRFIFSETFAAL